MARPPSSQGKSHSTRNAARSAGRGWRIGVGLALAAAIAWAMVEIASKRDSQTGVTGGLDEADGGGERSLMEPQEAAFARYAGSARCQSCHAEAYATWATSHHGLAERALRPGMDAGAFNPAREFKHGTQSSASMETNGEYHVITKGIDGRRESYRVERVIGHDPLRQFLVSGPSGRLQALEVAYDPRRQEWFDIYGDEDRQPGEWGHWTGRGMTWNSMCAACHNTRLRKNYDPGLDRYDTAMAERTVSCEACHGPMKRHVEWQEARGGRGVAEPAENRFSKEQVMATCGSCHARRYELTGDFVPGERFDDHYALTIADASEVYYADGQVREENYEYASFLSSRMHGAGVTCLDCHHPHAAKPMLAGNLLCLRCHSGGYPNSPIIDPARHSFHDPTGAGGQCVSCHMPQTTYMGRHPRRDHGFTIPDPLLTKELGIPNACNRCHRDQDADWALASVDRWYGERMERPARERARWIAAARRGEATARDPLMGMLRDEETPYWSAAAARLLDLWAAEPAVTRALVEGLNHTQALVRAQAASSLGVLVERPDRGGVVTALRERLGDASRHVRFEAAWALRASHDPASEAAREMRHALELNADFPSGQLQLGLYALSRDRLAEAEAHYARAVSWDPRSAALRHELAVVQSLAGRMTEAVEQLREACRLAPDEGEYAYKLGLALNEAGRPAESLEALELAVRLSPRHARAWYNLGLARHAAGHSESAVEALVRAESEEAQDPAIPYARATILMQLNRPEEARAGALRALEIHPGYDPALSFLRSLGGG